jgi:hypothetical protein
MRPAAAFTLAIALSLGACTTVEATGEEIVIEHAANQFLAAKLKAEEYCGEQGRVAQHVMTGPRKSSFLALQTSESVFRCVLEKAAAK